MKGYKIVFTSPKKVELQEYEIPSIKDSEVLIKVKYSLISNGTEKAVLNGEPNTTASVNGFPLVEGYSAVGIIEKTGSKIKSVKVGDRVFVEYGGHRNYVTKNIKHVYKIPNKVSFEEAVFTKIVSFPLAAIRRSRLEIGESIAIIGLGMLGLFGVQLAKIGGGLPVIAVGNRDIRREKAVEYGADYVFDPNDQQLTQKILDITEQKTIIRGASVIIETSGTEDGFIKCLEYSAKRGRVLLNGCQRKMSKPIDLYKYIHHKGVNLIGVHGQTRMPDNSQPGNWTCRRDYLTIFRLLEDGRLDAKSMISEYANPKDCAKVYERLINDKNFPLGVIFDWENF